MWSDIAGSLLALRPLPRSSWLTSEQWASLMQDLRSGQAHLMGLLQIKTQFWKALPWCLVGLASTSDQAARRAAAHCIAQFEKDPRQEAHHRLTWFWMQPGGRLRVGLDLFATTSIPLRELGAFFVSEVAKLRFVIVVETTIENKHARVTLARRTHAIGPVIVSLTNRILMLDCAWLASALGVR